MSSKPKRHKSWKDATLFQKALKTRSEDRYWDCVRELRSRGNREIFDTAKDLCWATKVRERQLGVDVISQHGEGFPFRDETLKVLHKMLETEKSPTVLDSILVGIGHAQESEDTFGVWRISSFRNHRSEDVREAVVFALLSRTDRISISTMKKLSRDKSPQVRDWATFGLGTQIELDTPSLRKALMDRVHDPDDNTRAEALMGLAKRKDLRVRPFLIQELEEDEVSSLIIEAAAELGDKTLLPYIEEHIASADKDTDAIWFYCATEARNELKDS